MASKKVQDLAGLAEGVVAVDHGSGSMISNAISYAADMGAAACRAAWTPSLTKTGVETETETWWLQQLDPALPATVERVPRKANAVRSMHGDVVSFSQWVSRRAEAAGKPEVFVAGNAVRAAWGLEGHGAQDTASLPLTACEAWQALRRLIQGVGQKELHKILITQLHGLLPAALALQIAMLSHNVLKNCDVAISRTGLADIQVGERLVLHFTGGQGVDEKAEVRVEWVYTGPVWTCFAAPISVPLRMVISNEKEGGLTFEFAPIGLEALLLAYRAQLAEEIEAKLETIPVYLGEVS